MSDTTKEAPSDFLKEHAACPRCGVFSAPFSVDKDSPRKIRTYECQSCCLIFQVAEKP